MRQIFTLTILFLFLLSCEPDSIGQNESDYVIADETGLENAGATDVGDLRLSLIKMPPGFKIEVWARVTGARSMARAQDGTLFVGTRAAGKVYALSDKDGDGKPDQVITIAQGLNTPNGVAYKNGDLYVAEIDRILKFPNILSQLGPSAPYEVLFDGYPSDTHHGWKYIAFGPDDLLYVPVGAPCNICLPPDSIYASITRFDVNDPKGPEIVQKGIRNTVGFDWHPKTGDLWFTDNGRDWLGDNKPACELNHATKDDQHFGYPFCHQGNLPDPEFGGQRSCSEFVPPAQNLGPHVAPLGMKFYSGNSFPTAYFNQPIIAEHGSWNRSTPIGYRVTWVPFNAQGSSLGYKVLAKGFLDESTMTPWGRPVDILVLPDGSILVSDDYGNAIYRIWYQP